MPEPAHLLFGISRAREFHTRGRQPPTSTPAPATTTSTRMCFPTCRDSAATHIFGKLRLPPIDFSEQVASYPGYGVPKVPPPQAPNKHFTRPFKKQHLRSRWPSLACPEDHQGGRLRLDRGLSKRHIWKTMAMARRLRIQGKKGLGYTVVHSSTSIQ